MSAATPASSSRKTPAAAYKGIAVLAALTVLYVPLRLMMESPDLSGALYNLFYSYGTALQVIFAAVIIGVALNVGLTQSVGRQWALIGAGVAAYAAGDVCWTLFDLVYGIDPYPSIADVFYSLEYVLFLAGIVLAVKAYSGLVSVKRPAIWGAIVGLAGIAIIYVALLEPYIFADASEMTFWELFFGVVYPVGDVLFMLAPAVTLALVVLQLGAGRLARPWWIVVAGATVFAIVDSIFICADWAGQGLTPLLDVGYIAANLLLASAALTAKKIYKVG